MDLEHRLEESVVISDVCDIVYDHAVKHFSVFIKYVINQAYQEKNYRRILWVPSFITTPLEWEPGLVKYFCMIDFLLKTIMIYQSQLDSRVSAGFKALVMALTQITDHLYQHKVFPDPSHWSSIWRVQLTTETELQKEQISSETCWSCSSVHYIYNWTETALKNRVSLIFDQKWTGSIRTWSEGHSPLEIESPGDLMMWHCSYLFCQTFL